MCIKKYIYCFNASSVCGDEKQAHTQKFFILHTPHKRGRRRRRWRFITDGHKPSKKTTSCLKEEAISEWLNKRQGRSSPHLRRACNSHNFTNMFVLFLLLQASRRGWSITPKEERPLKYIIIITYKLCVLLPSPSVLLAVFDFEDESTYRVEEGRVLPRSRRAAPAHPHSVLVGLKARSKELRHLTRTHRPG